MSVIDKIVRPNTRGMETVGAKIFRHLSEGAFDKETIKHGIAYIRKWIESTGLGDSAIQVTSVKNDYVGQSGYRLVKYGFVERKTGVRKKSTRGDTRIYFLDAPPNVCVGERTLVPDLEGDSLGKLKEELYANMQITGMFIGPTVKGGIPNNGFYDSQSSQHSAFGDTNPSGLRRGAIGIDAQGQSHLLTDDEKWIAVRNNFLGYKLMVGTSFYFTSEDTGQEGEIQQEVDRSVVSYLIEWRDQEGGFDGHIVSSI